MPTQYVDQDNKPVRIGRQIGRRGGEGSVYEASSHPGLVVKMYHEAPTDEQEAKILHLAQLARTQPDLLKFAAWPTALVRKNRTVPCGFLMPLVKGKEVHQLFGPRERFVEFPSVGWDFLVHVARNCAAVVDSVHDLGVVIGDVNEGNLLVAQDGTVRLIDCDSYQVSNGGLTWTCNVGIPLWTPPELQGRQFKGLQRTSNHDLFGLAVIIFKLLFMGRHPYAGIPLRAGDFVLETAIANYMFAFSPSSSALGLRPPPHCLPLSVFPPGHLQLFERAFMRGSELGRPTAELWTRALDSLLRELVQCGQDSSHKFPKSASGCPWCAIATGGGPNFFVSVTVAVTGSRADPKTLWMAITRTEKATLHVRSRSGVTIPSVAGTPLPMGVKTVRTQFIAGCMLLVMGIIFLLSRQSMLGIGVICIAIGMMNGGRVAEDFGDEKERREKAVTKAQQELDALIAELEQIPVKYDAEFRKRYEDLEKTYNRFLGLDREKAIEIQKLDQKKRDLQFADFLDRQLIVRASIRGIGPTRQAKLQAYGIETALDIKPGLSIPGFGPAYISRLMTWRQKCDSHFRFNATAPIPQHEIHQLNVRLTTLQNNLISDLKQGPQALATLNAQARGRISQLDALTEVAAHRVGQATADLKLMKA